MTALGELSGAERVAIVAGDPRADGGRVRGSRLPRGEVRATIAGVSQVAGMQQGGFANGYRRSGVAVAIPEIAEREHGDARIRGEVRTARSSGPEERTGHFSEV